METKNGAGLIVYSSKTGNTKKLAEGIHRVLGDSGFPARIAAVEEKPETGGAPWRGFGRTGGAPMKGFWTLSAP
jgi:hypothetical protein